MCLWVWVPLCDAQDLVLVLPVIAVLVDDVVEVEAEVVEALPFTLNSPDCARIPLFWSSLWTRLIWKPELHTSASTNIH